MPGSEFVSLSGMRANQQRVAAAAHNTANLSTDGFERQRLRADEAPSGGVRTKVDTVELSKEAREISESTEGPQNNVNTVEETISRIESKHGFNSNLKAFQASDRMMKSLLDTLA